MPLRPLTPDQPRPRRRSPGALALVAALLAGCGSGALEAGAVGGRLEFLPGGEVTPEDVEPRPYFHDFGLVADGEVVEHVFRMANTGDRPVRIERLSPSCGCTVPRLRYLTDAGEEVLGAPVRSEEPVLLEVPAGAVLELAVAVDTRNIRTKNTDKLLYVNMTTDAPDQLYLAFEAHIKVDAPFLVTPNGVNLNTVARSAGGSGSCEIALVPGSQYSLGEVLAKPDDVEVLLSERLGFGRRLWLLEVTVLPPLAEGRFERKVTLATFDPEGNPSKPLEVGITGIGSADIIADPARLVLVADADAPDPQSTEVVVRSLLAGQRFSITGATVEAAHEHMLAVSFAPEAPDAAGRSGRWQLTLTSKPPIAADDRLRGTLSIEVDVPDAPRVEVPYVLHVR